MLVEHIEQRPPKVAIGDDRVRADLPDHLSHPDGVTFGRSDLETQPKGFLSRLVGEQLLDPCAIADSQQRSTEPKALERIHVTPTRPEMFYQLTVGANLFEQRPPQGVSLICQHPQSSGVVTVCDHPMSELEALLRVATLAHPLLRSRNGWCAHQLIAELQPRPMLFLMHGRVEPQHSLCAKDLSELSDRQPRLGQAEVLEQAQGFAPVKLDQAGQKATTTIVADRIRTSGEAD